MEDARGEKLVACSALPPPSYHEAAVYPRTPPTRRLRQIAPARIALAVLLALQLSWILIWSSTRNHAPAASVLTALEANKFEAGLALCAANSRVPTRLDPKDRKANPRWDSVSGQNETIVLRNALLFDGEDYLDGPVDIVFSKGLIESVSPSAARAAGMGVDGTAKEMDLHGAWVTPGLVDMHSHHLTVTWPVLAQSDDSNEIYPDFGPLTPFVRIIDSLKAYDVGAKLIASGGVTSSLVLPGSANIMGGEGTLVKNAVRPGRNGEYVVEEMLLEHGIDVADRKRFMKMACGENPKEVYGHTRMGNTWVLRALLARAKELVDRQDQWCEAAAAAAAATMTTQDRARLLLAEKGAYPEELELDSTAGMLRGRVAMHNHCYEPEDFETMLRVSHEFGFRVRAFHHAISAWQVPEMLKEYGENLTIATFAEFALYKLEAYAASLSAGKILNEHGIPVAYKSDHALEDTSAQYLLQQAAVAHSFGLPADKALQAVTSVPAKSLEIDDRVGYARAGYDADLAVWDAHPLSVGATPKQVFIDGVATLDAARVEENTARVDNKNNNNNKEEPAMRATVSQAERERVCSESPGRSFVISGIAKAFLDEFPDLLMLTDDDDDSEAGRNLTLVVDGGEVKCLGAGAACRAAVASVQQQRDDDAVVFIHLDKGYLTRGLTAVTSTLGMAEISSDGTTGDGEARVGLDRKSRAVPYAKYGVSPGSGGKAFARARLGGVTRAVQQPVTGEGGAGGLVAGVSTGMSTGAGATLLRGGLFKEDVAMHVRLGEAAKADEGSIAMAIGRLRGLVRGGGRGEDDKEGVENNDDDPWALVANGSMPLVVKADSTHDIQQVILLKRDYPHVKVVILGGHSAPKLAHEIAESQIPLIFTGVRSGPDSWTKKDSLPGPPLSRSPADVLSEAGVFYGIAINTDGGPPGDSRIQSLALEASWAAKYAGLSEREALRLVSTNVDEILGLGEAGDVVVWEGSPLRFGTPVLALYRSGEGGVGGDGGLVVGSCWPDEADE